jgi:hypothetical protein
MSITYLGETITSVAETWNGLGNSVKIGLITYTVCTMFGFMLSTYNDGKEELVKRRNDRNAYNKKDDWISVKKACKQHVFKNFVDSIIFPFTIVSNIMPKIVLWLNPEDKIKF